MLALVHPFNPSPSPDTPHRTPSGSRTRQPHHRKPTPSSRDSTSSSSSATSSYSSSLYSASKPSVSVPMNGASSSSRHAPQPPAHRPATSSHSSAPLPPLAVPEEPKLAPTSNPKVFTSPAASDESLDIHSYPPPDLLRLLASLLTQIASTNDKLDAASSANSSSNSPTSSEPHPAIWRTLTTASRSALSTPSSTLTFHARNIPTISLEAYLLRILKYCPTTNEVFLSLLVYFDRMTKLTSEATGRSFVIDSYNIHRLVIAGVTVASKFFSDVFYTNSRYAKVGGLPLAELNQLELQFLLLNNFNLVIPKDEMQRYAEQLILFSSTSSPSNSPLGSGKLPSTPVISSPPSSAPSSGSSSATARPSTTNDMTAPMRSMGAIDAYGGRIPGDSRTSHSPHLQSGTPMARSNAHRGMESHPLSRIINPNQHQPHHALNGMVNGHGFLPSKMQTHDDSESEAGTETETETEAETETDGGWTTDDEPTIKPPRSSAGSSSSSSRSSRASDAHSICSSASEGGEGDDERDDQVMDGIEDDEEGGRTPEHAARLEGVKDAEKTPERRPLGQLGMSKISRRREEDESMASP